MNRVLRMALVACFALCTLVLIRPSYGQVGVGVSVNFAPPALPVYALPPCPGDGYLWTPGYWAWDPDYGYYWVPGTWVMAPEPGLLWTPGWWGWENGGFLFHDGYWATDVGFYGGIDYGFGYFGVGFVGGMWRGGVFRYNTAVLRVNTREIHNTYMDRGVIENREDNHVSYNGGEGGITARPTPAEERVDSERHVPPPSAQQKDMDAARGNPEMRASENHGKPAIAATARPGEFSGHGVVKAKEAGGAYHAPANAPGEHGEPAAAGGHPGEAPAAHEENPTHASDLKPHQVTAPNTGNPKLDKKYEKQQQKLVDKQNKEHEKLEQQQEKDHQRAKQQNYSQQKQAQMEQRHAQQTQKMEQRHAAQTEHMQMRQAPPSRRR